MLVAEYGRLLEPVTKPEEHDELTARAARQSFPRLTSLRTGRCGQQCLLVPLFAVRSTVYGHFVRGGPWSIRGKESPQALQYWLS